MVDIFHGFTLRVHVRYLSPGQQTCWHQSEQSRQLHSSPAAAVTLRKWCIGSWQMWGSFIGQNDNHHLLPPWAWCVRPKGSPKMSKWVQPEELHHTFQGEDKCKAMQKNVSFQFRGDGVHPVEMGGLILFTQCIYYLPYFKHWNKQWKLKKHGK